MALTVAPPSVSPVVAPSPALCTDHYELTMVEAALASGVASHRAVFEVFARSLPLSRRVGVFAGVGRLLAAIAAFRFDTDTVRWLTDMQIVSETTGRWLANYRFGGTITGYAEGELYVPHSPVLTIEASFAEAVLLETLVLSMVNADSAVATTAARMVFAAAGTQLIEMGSRRTNEEAAVAAARAAWIAGFDATSNLAAGKRYGIPTVGTAAHAFTLAHPSEAAAFDAQIAALGTDTTLLVDTYDIRSGIAAAVGAARRAGAAGPGAIRIDSGDLAVEAAAARSQLDALGAAATKIVVSGDLDEKRIAAIAAACAPVDCFGVGTRLVAGASCPPPGFVFKLVAIADSPDLAAPMRPVAKRAAGKQTYGGRKTAWRRVDRAVAREVIVVSPAVNVPAARALQVPLMVDGTVVCDTSAAAARARFAASIAEVPAASDLGSGPPAITTTIEIDDPAPSPPADAGIVMRPTR